MMRPLIPIRLRIDQAGIETYAALSDDYNPIHTDPVFAAATPLGGVIAHGTLSLNLLLESIEQTFGVPLSGSHELSVRFKAPVREGDIVEAGGQPGEDGCYDVWVRKQDGFAVIEGTARLAI
jgi:3-hydroxybutyryl-CoA dehydratase